jgi:hypothetical protein
VIGLYQDIRRFEWRNRLARLTVHRLLRTQRRRTASLCCCIGARGGPTGAPSRGEDAVMQGVTRWPGSLPSLRLAWLGLALSTPSSSKFLEKISSASTRLRLLSLWPNHPDRWLHPILVPRRRVRCSEADGTFPGAAVVSGAG